MIIPTYPNAAGINAGRYPILMNDIQEHVEGEYTDIQKDLAYKIQEETSENMCELIEIAHELTGEKNIVVCGGYGLNCVANYKYWQRFPDLNIYCEPILMMVVHLLVVLSIFGILFMKLQNQVSKNLLLWSSV